MIRVLQVVGKLALGGAETRLLELARSTDKSKFYFDFCVFEDGDYDHQVRQLGYGIVKCRLTKNIFSFSRQFSSLLRQGRYDVIHCHIYQFSGLPLRIAAKEGIPRRIMHLRTTKSFHRSSLYRLCYNKLMTGWIQRYATKIVAVSETAMIDYIGPEWKSDIRTSVIYNGLDVTPFKSLPDRSATLAEFGIPSSAQVVVHVGNFRPVKDHKTLIKTASMMISRNKAVHFLLVGCGYLMSDIRKLVLAEGLEGNIHFAGPRKDVPRLLMASDCFVFPSRWEGLPGAVIEALAAGLPVVASAIGSIREIASQSDSVHLVPAGNADGFAQKIEWILADLERYRKSPGEVPERFRFENYAENMLCLYE